MLATPDIDQSTTKYTAEEHDRNHWCEQQQSCDRVGKHPGKVGLRDCGFLEHAGVALDEEDVEEEV